MLIIILICQIQSDLFDCRCKRRWIVLENSSSEEDIVAAACFLLDIEKKTATVDLLCSIGDDVDTRNWRYCALLKKIESIVRSHSCTFVIIEIANWRTDAQDLVTRLGYVDSGGRLDESERSLLFVKQTMVLEFKKEFLSLEKEEENRLIEMNSSEEHSLESVLSGATENDCVVDIGIENDKEGDSGAWKSGTKDEREGTGTETKTETEASSLAVDIRINNDEDEKSSVILGEKLFHDSVIVESGILESVILTGPHETGVESETLLHPVQNSVQVPVQVPPREGGMEGLMSQLFRALRSENVKAQP